MNWKFDFTLIDHEIPESNYGKSVGGIDMRCIIHSIKKEELIRLDYCSLRELQDILKEALNDVKEQIDAVKAVGLA